MQHCLHYLNQNQWIPRSQMHHCIYHQAWSCFIGPSRPGRCGWYSHIYGNLQTNATDYVHRHFLWHCAQDTFDDTPTLVQVMAWCLTAPSHYLSQYWHICMSPLGYNELILKWQTFWKSPWGVNSLSLGRCDRNFECIISNSTITLNGHDGNWDAYNEIALRWIPQNPSNEKSTLIQVMAWHHQATSHYLRQC